MEFKIFRVEFTNGINEYDIPTGWQINQTLFSTDTHAVFVLSKYTPVQANPSYDGTFANQVFSTTQNGTYTMPTAGLVRY